MPVKRSSTGGALSWIVAVVLVSVAAIGVGWLIGQQVLNLMSPPRSSVSDTSSQTPSYSYYPWQSQESGQTPTSSNATTPTIQLPTTAPAAQPKTQPAPTPVPQPTPVQPSSPVLYRVRVGSFSTREAAQAAAAELAAKGHPTYVVGPAPYYVQVGAFERQANANALSDSLKAQGYQVVVVK